MTLLAAMSASGNSAPPVFSSQYQTFETERLFQQELFQSHDDVIRTAEQRLITEFFSVSWLQNLVQSKKRLIAHQSSL
jgi:hypothetical protein